MLPFATEADTQGLLTMLFSTWLSGGNPPLFMDFRKVWEPWEIQGLAQKLGVPFGAGDLWAQKGIVDGNNSGSASFDWAGRPGDAVEKIMSGISMPGAELYYFPGGGNSVTFITPGGIDCIAGRLAYSALSGMFSMFWDEATTVDLPEKLADAVAHTSNWSWPHTFIVPKYATMAEYKQYAPANHFHATWGLKPSRLQYWMDLSNVLSATPWSQRPQWLEGADRPQPLLFLLERRREPRQDPPREDGKMSNDGLSPEDQAAIGEVARGVMRQLAAGRSPEDVARELQVNGWQKSTADALVEHVLEDWRRIEAAPQANAVLYLQMKYPEMQPAGSVPMLYSVHGIGTGFYGSRDLDRPTGSYVKTQCFCLLLIPIFALKAYRVTSRGAGWNLIGRVPLSRFAKAWNILFPCAILACIGFGILSDYFNGPAYQAGRKLARADEAAAAGNLPEASRLYREVAGTRTEHSAVAAQRMRQAGRAAGNRRPAHGRSDSDLQRRARFAPARRRPAGGAGPWPGNRERPRPGRPHRFDRASGPSGTALPFRCLQDVPGAS